MKKEFFCLFDSVPWLLAPLFDACEAPWEMLSHLSDFLYEIAKNPPKGFYLWEDGSDANEKCPLPGDARGEDYSQPKNSASDRRTLSGSGGWGGSHPRRSGILIGEGVKIEDFATIMPPAVICPGAEIRQGAYLRGSVFLGEGAIAGHGTEMKNTVLMDGAKAPHLSYLGDSILGENAHLGAGVILSNLRLDKGEIFVNLTALQNPDNSLSNAAGKAPAGTAFSVDKKVPTGRRKLGSIIGDNAEIACGTVLNPGTIIPKNSIMLPK